MHTKRLLWIIVFILTSTISQACDCNDIIDVEKSKLVFKGKVISVEKLEGLLSYAITFKVKKKVKGIIKGRKITIYTPCLSEQCCGIPFLVGDVYFIVTKSIHDKYYATRCTNTSKVKSGKI